MKLKCIELLGFKSFPDKTKITINEGLTAIIGPNGSGKSNVSDAVRWVLGEMSLKSLRGSKMEDVIFNGTPKRAPANYTYVSLYLDTGAEYSQSRELDMIEAADTAETAPKLASRIRLSDQPEVVITRRYYRSGESEYYINKKQVRLKDVYELFYDTGIGREGYSVIGQGKIAEVLSVKDDERRSIFEEAAGISKFRYKKTESERKLRDTENNLLRINDILSELTSRIGPLEKEAENAKEYIVLSEEKKTLEVTLWLDRIDKIRGELKDSELTLAAAKLELELSENEIHRTETENENFVNQGYALMQQKGLLEKDIADIEAKLTKNQGEIALEENNIGHSRELIEKNRAELSLSAASENESRAASEAEKIRFNEIYDNLSAWNEKIKSKEDDCFKVRATTLGFSENENKLSAECERCQKEWSDLDREHALLLQQSETASKSREEYRALKETSENRIALLAKELEEYKKCVDKWDAEALALRDELHENEQKAAAARAEKSGLDDLISTLKIKAAAQEQKRESLLRLERLFEGYSDAVKTVMRHGEEGKIKNGSRGIKIHGTVASVFSTDGEYVVALETALGASVQFVVVESESDAKAAIAYLKRIGGGRATFLPLDTVRGRIAEVNDIKAMPGYIGIASELVKCDKQFMPVANELLGRTVIAEDIDAASEIARRSGYRIKIVTKDGQIINAGGSFTGGSSAQKVGVFTRGIDIEKLDTEIREANGRLITEESHRRRLVTAVEAADTRITELRADLERLGAESEKQRANYSAADARYSEETAKLAGLADSQKNDLEKTEYIQSKLKELELAGNQASLELARVREALVNAKQLTVNSRSGESRLIEELSALKMERVRLETELENTRLQINSILTRADSLSERAKVLRAESERAEKSIASALLKKEEIQQSSLKLKRETAEIGQRLEDIEKKLLTREEKSAELRFNMKTAATRKEQAFVAFTNLDSRVKAAQAEYDQTVNRLWEEYELTYSEAEPFRQSADKMIKAQTRINYLKSRIRAMGTINVGAVDEYALVKERYDFLTGQVDDLNKTRRSLDSVIAKLNNTMKECFLDTFNAINTAFSEVFIALFGGGTAKLELNDPLLPLECGIDIIIRPPGKSVKSISLLSGGEQSFAAIALYLALQRINPSPFCIFDEIESALDDVNLIRFVDYVKGQCDKTQYIMITHRRGTMERADTLYGITMHERGISDYIRLDVAKLEENLKEYVKIGTV